MTQLKRPLAKAPGNRELTRRHRPLMIHEAAPFSLVNAQIITNVALRFGFTKNPGVLFSAVATANLAEPLSNWMVVTGRFYRVRSP
jgi:hypothetical protein